MTATLQQIRTPDYGKNGSSFAMMSYGGKLVPVINGIQFDDNIKSAIRVASKTKRAPNLDNCLYHEGNAENWKNITSSPAYYPRDEVDVIQRRAASGALHDSLGSRSVLVALGGAAKFAEKERQVIVERTDEGHEFESIIQIDGSSSAITDAMQAGDDIISEKGLDTEQYESQGEMFDLETYEQIRPLLEGKDLILTCFGLTLQNLEGDVENYEDAVKALSEKLKKLKAIVKSLNPTSARLLATFDLASSRDDILGAYSGKNHDDFLLSAVKHHMGDVVQYGKPERKFIPRNSSILNRDFVLSQDVVVQLETDEQAFLGKNTIAWHGVSAKMPEKYVTQAYEKARVPVVVDRPCVDRDGRIACYEFRLAP